MKPVRLKPSALGLESSFLPLSHCALLCLYVQIFRVNEIPGDKKIPVGRVITRGSHITYYTLMFFIAYAFKGQVHMFAGRVNIVSHSSCRTCTVLKYVCPQDTLYKPVNEIKCLV